MQRVTRCLPRYGRALASTGTQATSTDRAVAQFIAESSSIGAALSENATFAAFIQQTYVRREAQSTRLRIPASADRKITAEARTYPKNRIEHLVIARGERLPYADELEYGV